MTRCMILFSRWVSPRRQGRPRSLAWRSSSWKNQEGAPLPLQAPDTAMRWRKAYSGALCPRRPGRWCRRWAPGPGPGRRWPPPGPRPPGPSSPPGPRPLGRSPHWGSRPATGRCPGRPKKPGPPCTGPLRRGRSANVALRSSHCATSFLFHTSFFYDTNSPLFFQRLPV